jgi:hypothetical protein
MKILMKSPITAVFILLEVFLLSRYFYSKPGVFIDPLYLEAWTGAPLAYLVLVFIPLKWPDVLMLRLRERIASKGAMLSFRLLLFIGGAVYFTHLALTVLKRN